jgi:hypothetical protein
MDSARKKTVQMTLGQYMTKTMLERLKGPSGQAMVRQLTDILTFQILQMIERELRAMAKESGGQLDIERVLTRLKLPKQ